MALTQVKVGEIKQYLTSETINEKLVIDLTDWFR